MNRTLRSCSDGKHILAKIFQGSGAHLNDGCCIPASGHVVVVHGWRRDSINVYVKVVNSTAQSELVDIEAVSRSPAHNTEAVVGLHRGACLATPQILSG